MILEFSKESKLVKNINIDMKHTYGKFDQTNLFTIFLTQNLDRMHQMLVVFFFFF